jgi:hypothetical protein
MSWVPRAPRLCRCAGGDVAAVLHIHVQDILFPSGKARSVRDAASFHRQANRPAERLGFTSRQVVVIFSAEVSTLLTSLTFSATPLT